MKTKLKVDLHLHSLEDIKDDSARCSARELIDLASQKGFDVLSITNHDVVTYNKALSDYAAERGILLIAGMEATIQKKHVLLYNFDFSRYQITTFNDIKRLKADDNLCLAPHPFYPSSTSLNTKFYQYVKIFDGLEFCHFYSKQINFNKKAIEKSLKYGLPLVGMSDTHMASQFGYSYSLVEAKKEVGAIIRAIKAGKVEVISQPLRNLRLSEIGLKLLLDEALNLFGQTRKNKKE